MATAGTRHVERFVPVNGYWEPSMSLAMWPGCPCGAPHPMASRSDSKVCLACGAPVAQNAYVEHVPAAITGWSPAAILARLNLWLGKVLIKIANKV